MSEQKFIIAPHMRLHEWVTVEQGYFDESREWVAAHDIFPDGNLGNGDYGAATISTIS